MQIWDKSRENLKSFQKIGDGPISLLNSKVYLGLNEQGKNNTGIRGSIKHATAFKKQFEND